MNYIVKLGKATDQAKASIVELVEKEIIGKDEVNIIHIDEIGKGQDYDIMTRNYLRGRQRTRLTQEDTE